MSTLGTVSILKNNEMQLKVVVGCNGDIAGSFADDLVRTYESLGHLPNAVQVEDMAREQGFGCKQCRVIVGTHIVWSPIEGNLYMHPDAKIHREHFNDSQFHSRWEIGMADHTEVRCV